MLDAFLVVVLVITALIVARKRQPSPAPVARRPPLRLQARLATAVVAVGAVAYMALQLFK